MKNYFQYENRLLIEKGIKEKLTYEQIAKSLEYKFRPLGIKNEVQKNGGKKLYEAKKAQDNANYNKIKKYKHLNIKVAADQQERIVTACKKGTSIGVIAVKEDLPWHSVNQVLIRHGLVIIRKKRTELQTRVGALEMQMMFVMEELEKKGR